MQDWLSFLGVLLLVGCSTPLSHSLLKRVPHGLACEGLCTFVVSASTVILSTPLVCLAIGISVWKVSVPWYFRVLVIGLVSGAQCALLHYVCAAPPQCWSGAGGARRAARVNVFQIILAAIALGLGMADL